VYSPDWRLLLKQGRRVPQVPQSVSPLATQTVGAAGATTRATLPPTAKAGGLPQASSWQGRLGGLLARGAEALGDVESRSVPGDTLGHHQRGFLDGAKAGTGAKATSEPGRKFPVVSQQESGCTITSRLYGLVEMQEVEAVVASSVAGERLLNLGHELMRAGHTESQVDAVLSLEWYIRDFSSAWKREADASGSRRTLSEWALCLMTTTDFHKITSFDELEAQVRALSRLVGLTYEEATGTILRIWCAGSSGTHS
jgi:hypothetical protein